LLKFDFLHNYKTQDKALNNTSGRKYFKKFEISTLLFGITTFTLQFQVQRASKFSQSSNSESMIILIFFSY